jgi:hypothetical protein
VECVGVDFWCLNLKDGLAILVEVCTHAHAHTRTRTHTRTHAHTHTRTHAHTHTRTHAHTHTRTHAHTRTHTHAHTRTHTHAHAQDAMDSGALERSDVAALLVDSLLVQVHKYPPTTQAPACMHMTHTHTAHRNPPTHTHRTRVPLGRRTGVTPPSTLSARFVRALDTRRLAIFKQGLCISRAEGCAFV